MCDVRLFLWDRTSESAGELAAASTGGQISSRLLSMRSTNALLELPAVSALIILDSFGLCDSSCSEPLFFPAPHTLLKSILSQVFSNHGLDHQHGLNAYNGRRLLRNLHGIAVEARIMWSFVQTER